LPLWFFFLAPPRCSPFFCWNGIRFTRCAHGVRPSDAVFGEKADVALELLERDRKKSRHRLLPRTQPPHAVQGGLALQNRHWGHLGNNIGASREPIYSILRQVTLVHIELIYSVLLLPICQSQPPQCLLHHERNDGNVPPPSSTEQHRPHPLQVDRAQHGRDLQTTGRIKDRRRRASSL
jgi:hypothetical protein